MTILVVLLLLFFFSVWSAPVSPSIDGPPIIINDIDNIGFNEAQPLLEWEDAVFDDVMGKDEGVIDQQAIAYSGLFDDISEKDDADYDAILSPTTFVASNANKSFAVSAKRKNTSRKSARTKKKTKKHHDPSVFSPSKLIVVNERGNRGDVSLPERHEIAKMGGLERLDAIKDISKRFPYQVNSDTPYQFVLSSRCCMKCLERHFNGDKCAFVDKWGEKFSIYKFSSMCCTGNGNACPERDRISKLTHKII